MSTYWDPEDLDVDVDEYDDLIDIGYIRSGWHSSEDVAVFVVRRAAADLTNDAEWNREWTITPKFPDQPFETVKRHDGAWEARIRVTRPYVHVPLEAP